MKAGGNILALPVRWLRILSLAGASFTVNEVPVRAAALTFTTLLAIIPFVIILSSVAGTLGYLHLLTRFIPYLTSILHLDLPLEPVLTSIERAQGISFHKLGLWGTLGLLLTFFIAMGEIEYAVNRVWNLHGKRGLLRRLKVYTPFLFLLIFIVLFGVWLLLLLRRGVEKWGFIGALPDFGFQSKSVLVGSIGMFVFLWFGLVLMIRLVPATRVKAGAAIFGATASTAAIYLLTRILFLALDRVVVQNSFLYGSLAIIPVGLLLIYVLWATALFGAAVAFIHQSLTSEFPEENDSKVHPVRRIHPFHSFWEEILKELRRIYFRRKL